MASQFSGSSTVPVVSCNTMLPKEPLTRANIERVVAATNADAVLTTAVVTMQLAKGQGYTGMPYYQVEGVGYVTGPVGAYGVPVAFVQLETPPHIPTITGDIHLITKLFDTHDAALVYTLDTRAKTDDLQSDPVAIDTITEIIAGRLRHDGVIH
jgi:nitrate/nitrite transporter NarK